VVFRGRDLNNPADYPHVVGASFDLVVRALSDGAHDAAASVLAENRELLDRLADELVEHETLEAERVQELFADVQMFAGDINRGPVRPPARHDGAPVPGRAGAAAAREAHQPHRGGPA
jgi:hypothetical protein